MNENDIKRGNKTQNIHLRITQETADRFKSIADRSEVPVSTIYRTALSKYLSESDGNKELAAFEAREMKRKEYFGCLNEFSNTYTQVKRLGQNINQFLIKIRTGQFSSTDADEAEKVLHEIEDVLKAHKEFLLDYGNLEVDFQPGGMYSGYGK